eukprot:jgi/Botrbrau1/19808/Bobra.0124s0051.1
MTGSGFVECPACAVYVPYATINMHLDTDCLAMGPPTKKQKREGSGQRTSSVATGDGYSGDATIHEAKTTKDEDSEPTVGLPHSGSPSIQKSTTCQGTWWNPGKDSRAVAVWIKSRPGQTTPLTALELKRLLPVEVLAHALPDSCARNLLISMLEDSPHWERGSWWFAGVHQKAPRTSCLYNFQEEASCAAPHPEKMEAESSPQEDDSTSVSFIHRPPTQALLEAASLVAVLVNQRLKNRKDELESSDREGWEPSYVLANLYKDGQDSVGAHSDRLTSLGPRPIIASLSLGARRSFRLTRKGLARLPADPSRIDRIDIPLPHNTLLIMWPPCQEEWVHEVPKTKSVGQHTVAGLQRVNLTFRKMKPDWSAMTPSCSCRRPAVLRAHTNGYFYVCDNTQGATCNFRARAPEVPNKASSTMMVALAKCPTGSGARSAP